MTLAGALAAAGGSGAVTSGAASRPLLRPEGIQLGVLMGAGSTGRVYAGDRRLQAIVVRPRAGAQAASACESAALSATGCLSLPDELEPCP